MQLRVGAAIVTLMVVVMGAVGYSDAWHRLPTLAAYESAVRASDADASLEALVRYIQGSSPSATEFDVVGAVTQVGHWRLKNRAGEPFTVAGLQELTRALSMLTPAEDRSAGALRVLVDSQSVFGHEQALRALPREIDVSVLIEGRHFGVAKADAGAAGIRIVIRPGLLVDVRDRTAFLEVLRQLERPIARVRVRMIALEPGGAPRLRRMPIVEPRARNARPDIVDPTYLGSSLAVVSGQTVLLSGRFEGEKLVYKPGSGPEGEIAMDALQAAIQSSEASFILLDATSARQPGTRNWLWQRIALSSMEEALGGATFGEFLRALAGEPETLVVKAKVPENGRIDLIVEPLVDEPPATVARFTQVVSGTWSSIVSETAGSVSVRTLKASMLTTARQRELDRRIVPGIPFVAQVGYLVLLAVGLLGFPTVNAWWSRVWPNEVAADYGSRTGLVLANVTRGLALVLLFLPAVGLPALCLRLSRMAKVYGT